MPITISVPNLIQGVSQQPDALRLPGQMEECLNSYLSVVDGAAKRHPTSHITKAINGNAGSAQMVVVNRDLNERYQMILRNGDLKMFGMDGTSYLVKAPGGGAPTFTYLNAADVQNLRAVSVADYTFVLNREITTAMKGTTTAASPSARKAFIFVERGNYRTNYRVSLQRSGADWRTAVVSTWNGTTAFAQQEVWSITINTTGAVGTTWTVTFAGPTTATYVVVGGDTTATVAAGLRQAINNKANMSAWGSLSGISILADDGGFDLGSPVTCVNSGAGTCSITEERTSATLELTNIKTDLIASNLAQIISTFPGYTASSTGAVIRITTTTDLTAVDIQDSVGDSLLTTMWKSVPLVSDLPLICEDAYTIKVDGGTPDTGDDFYVKFVADVAGAFGTGRWDETVGPGIAYQLDGDLMPWQLIRVLDDAFGTVTGTPFGKYFTWGPATWNDREFGDTTTNKNPTFVGKTITDIFFFKNRLGFSSDQNLILSENGRYFNFFRTTVQTLVDSDRIDISANTDKVSLLHSAVLVNGRLIASSEFTQFELQGEPVLTPTTAALVPILSYEASKTVRPLASGRSLYFARQRGQFGIVYEMVPEQSSERFQAADITEQVPHYISGNVITFAASPMESLLLVLSDGDRSMLTVYQFYESSEGRVQSAWSKWDFGDAATIRGMGFVGSTLYLAIQRTEGLFLESMSIAPSATDTNSSYVTRVDRRITESGLPVAYSAITNRTTFTLPYNVEAAETTQVITRCTSPDNGGANLTVYSASGTQVVLQGDQRSKALWFGQRYIQELRLSKPRLRESARRGGQQLVVSGRLQILWGSLVYDRSGYFTVEVTPLNRSTSSYPFGPQLGAGGAVIGQVGLPSGVWRFPVLCKNDEAAISLKNDSPLPSNLVALEYEAHYHSRSSRLGG